MDYLRISELHELQRYIQDEPVWMGEHHQVMVQFTWLLLVSRQSNQLMTFKYGLVIQM
jgi:hypothetical protein